MTKVAQKTPVDHTAKKKPVEITRLREKPVKFRGLGVVKHYVLAPEDLARRAAIGFSTFALVNALQEGLPFRELEELQESLEMPMEKLAPLLGISKATLHRTKNNVHKPLSPTVSDRVVRYARLLGMASEVMGGREEALRWLNSPQIGLGGAVPLEFAKTEIGGREVENLLGRIEFGVYS